MSEPRPRNSNAPLHGVRRNGESLIAARVAQGPNRAPVQRPTQAPAAARERAAQTSPAQDRQALVTELRGKFERHDYQGRDVSGRSIRSGVPDTMSVGTDWRTGEPYVVAEFKDTSEGAAKRWLENHVHNEGYKTGRVTSEQSGDYHDDWVRAYVTIKGKRR